MLENSKSDVIKNSGNLEIGINRTGRKSFKELFDDIHQKKKHRKIDDYDYEDNNNDDDDADCFCD